MRRNQSIIGASLLTAFAAIVMSGCSDRLVSQDEFMDTAMTRGGPVDAEIYGYVPPYESRAVDLTTSGASYEAPPRVIVIQGSGPDPADGNVAITPSDRSAGAFREFNSNVNRQLELLDRDLAQLQARATIKGAAAEAAVEPAARDVRMYRDQIESRMNDLRNVEDLSISETQQTEIRDLLQDARRSLSKAEEEVNRIPAVD